VEGHAPQAQAVVPPAGPHEGDVYARGGAVAATRVGTAATTSRSIKVLNICFLDILLLSETAGMPLPRSLSKIFCTCVSVHPLLRGMLRYCAVHKFGASRTAERADCGLREQEL